jgi:hypothetical protein
MATTITAPKQESDSFVPGWLLGAVAALAAFAVVVLLAIAMDSDSTADPAPAARVAPESGQVVGSADSIDHGTTSPVVRSADSIDRAPTPEPVNRVPGRAF